jgi:hypothetical protein
MAINAILQFDEVEVHLLYLGEDLALQISLDDEVEQISFFKTFIILNCEAIGRFKYFHSLICLFSTHQYSKCLLMYCAILTSSCSPLSIESAILKN